MLLNVYTKYETIILLISYKLRKVLMRKILMFLKIEKHLWQCYQLCHFVIILPPRKHSLSLNVYYSILKLEITSKHDPKTVTPTAKRQNPNGSSESTTLINLCDGEMSLEKLKKSLKGVVIYINHFCLFFLVGCIQFTNVLYWCLTPIMFEFNCWIQFG